MFMNPVKSRVPKNLREASVKTSVTIQSWMAVGCQGVPLRSTLSRQQRDFVKGKRSQLPHDLTDY